MTRNRIGAVAVLATLSLAAAGCGYTVEDLPLPKPSGTSGDTIDLTADFMDALNLPQDAKVQLRGTQVGSVTDITTSNYEAHVKMKVDKDIALPVDGTVIELRQATPLGDVYVALEPPERAISPGEALYTSGSTIPVKSTKAAASVEQLLIQAAALINGGALVNAAKLIDDVNSMVGGKAPQLQNILNKLTSITGSINARTDALDRTLKQTDTLLTTVNLRKDEMGRVANSVPAMVNVLAQNNQAITELIAKTASVSDALGDFSARSGQNLNGMLQGISNVMSGISAWSNHLAGFADNVARLTPNLNGSTKSTALNTDLIIESLWIGGIWDPSGSKLLPDITDLTGLATSLNDTIAQVFQRLNGGH